jgi:hypothetical protein
MNGHAGRRERAIDKFGWMELIESGKTPVRDRMYRML